MAEHNRDPEGIENNEQDKDSLTIDNENNSSDENTAAPENNKELNKIKNDLEKSKKKSTISKILISLIAFLVLLLLIGIILYSLGFFTPEEIIEEKPLQGNISAIEEKKENYKFDINNINSKKLNEQLAYLTNKNIYADKNEELERIENEKKLIEEQKRKEEEALKAEEEALLQEKKEIEEKKIQLENEKIQLEAMRQEALLLKEELEANKIKLEELKQNPIEEIVAPLEIPQEANEAIENITLKQEENSFLKLINVAKIKGSLYKKYLDSITSINTNVILCRDDKNRIEIYFGPFDNDEIRTNLLNKLTENGFEEAYELELTKDEFDKRCNY